MEEREMRVMLYDPFEDDEMISEFISEYADDYSLWLLEKGLHPDDDAPDYEMSYVEANDETFVDFSKTVDTPLKRKREFERGLHLVKP